MAYPFARPQAALLLQTDSSDPPGLPPVGAPLSSAPPADLPPPPTTALDAVTALQLGDPSTWALPPMTPVPSHVPTPRVEPEAPDPYAQMRFSLEQPRGAGGSPRPPVNTPTIGAARIGDRYEPKSWGQIMTSDTPIQDILEHVLGPKRPPSVYSADPMGAQAALINAGPPPMFGAQIEPVGDMTTWLAALVKRNPELAGLAKAAGDTHPSRLFDHVDSVQTFEHLAREGKLQQATGKFTKAEEAAQTPVSAGELAGYSPADIAHFYVARRGGRADYAAYELVKNLHAEGRPVNAALWDQVVKEPPKGYRLEGTLYVPEGPPKGLYSRVDAFVETLPNTALHPSKWKALLQSNASAEELEWRGVLDYLTQQGQTKLTPADLRAYLAAHPPPTPALKVLRSPEPKPAPAPGQGVTDLDLYLQQEHQGHRPTTPVQWDELAEELQNRADETAHPTEAMRLNELADAATGRGEGAQAPQRPISPLLADYLQDRHVGDHPAPTPTTPAEWQDVYDELVRATSVAEHDGDDMLAIRYEALADLAAGHMNAARTGAPTEAAPWLDDWLQQRHGPAPTTAMAWSEVADELDDFGRRAEANGDTEAAHRYDLMAGEAEARGATAPGAVNQFIGTPVDPARPRYGQYTLPGGVRYRENLTILAPRPHPSRQPRGGEWSHFNVTVRDHGGGIRWRSTDAVTAADVQRLRDQYETPTAPTARWTVEATPAPAPPDPTVDFRSGHWDQQPNILVHTRSNERELPGWGRGHFIEEVQSDWHQRGKTAGYRTQLPPEQERRLAQIDDEMREWTIKLSTANQESHAAILTTRHRSGLDAYQAVEAGRAEPGDHVYLDARSRANEASDALNALRREQHDIRGGHEQVPDVPFKESWPDLALKQHLLEAADDPAAQWVAFTSGGTQAARYDLRKEINRLVFEPEERDDFTFGTLVAYDHNGDVVLQEGGLELKDLDQYIGTEPADKLRAQIEVHAKRTHEREVDQWSAEENPRAEGTWNVVDQNGNDLRDRNGRIRNFRHEDEARDVADEKNRIDWESALPKIEGMDLEVGGEGMTYFYDKLLPARLDKILKKFGAKVERTTIRVPLEKAGRNTGKTLGLAVFDSAPPSSLIDGKLPVGPNRKLYSRELLGEAFRTGELNLFHLPEPLRRAVEARGIDEPIWIVRLSAEVKARLRKEGLPLMAGAPVGALALQARQDDRRPAGPPLAVSHAQTPPPAPSASPAALATLAQRFPRFAAALATHPPPAAQPPLEALRKATSIGADPRRAEARAVMEPAYRPAASPRPPVIRAPSTSEWLTDLEQRFYRMLSQTLPGQASDATGLLTDFAGKAEELEHPPALVTSIVPPPGGDSAKKVAQAIEAGLAKQEAGGAVRKAVEIVNDKAAAHFAVAPGERVNDRLIVSTRVPTSKPAPPLAPSLDPLMTGVEDIARDPDLMKKIADRLRKDPLLTDAERKLNDRGVLDAFVEKGAQNTLGLIKMQPGEQVTQSRRWYQGAHDMGNRFGAAVGVSGEQGAAALAAESPSKEWNQNVEISRRIMEWWKELRSKDTVFDQAIFDQHASNAIKSTEQWIIDKKLTGAKADAYRALKAAKLEKTRLQIDKPWSALPERVKAQMVRAMDELHNAQTYPVYGPDGTIAHTLALKADKKTPKKLTWQSFDNVANALSMLEDGSAHNISKRVGKGHKVRSFFNNINVPTDPRSATADTHNVGGVHLRPMGGSAPEVKFVMAGPGSAETGIKGAHGLYRDATIMASHARPDLGLLPNQTQSVAWESIKGLFSPAQRRDPAFRQRIVDFYSAFQRGNISMEQLHERIYDAAGGLDKPEWGAR